MHTGKSSVLKDLGRGLLQLFFPRLCLGCKRALIQAEEALCFNCETYLSYTESQQGSENEATLRLAGRVPFLHAMALANFANDSLIQHLVHQLKYQGRREAASFLGRELGRTLKSLDWNIDALVPVPLYKSKALKRGFNQSELLCQAVAEVLGVPVIDGCLVRIRNTETQTRKTREQRLENVAGAFRVIDEKKLEGKHVLLIDDVLTTGATMEACILAMREVPGLRVSLAAIGIATN